MAKTRGKKKAGYHHSNSGRKSRLKKSERISYKGLGGASEEVK